MARPLDHAARQQIAEMLARHQRTADLATLADEDALDELLATDPSLLGRVFAAWTVHDDPRARALVGPMVAEALLAADHEVQSCSGEQHAWHALTALMQAVPDIVDRLVAQLDDADARVRAGATRGIGGLFAAHDDDHLGDRVGRWPPPPPARLWAMLADVDAIVRREAAAASAGLPAQADHRLLACLGDDDPDVRAAAARVAARHLGAAAVPGLAADGRRDAAEALVALDAPDAAAVIATALGHAPGGYDLEQWLWLVGSAVAPSASGRQLAAYLAPTYPERARHHAARALCRWAHPGAGDALVDCLDADGVLPVVAAIALARTPRPGSEGALARRMRAAHGRFGAHRQACTAVTWALGRMATPAAREALLTTPVSEKNGPGPHPNDWVQAIGLLEDPDLLPVLERRILDTPYARRTAAIALGLCGHPDAAPRLLRWLGDKDRRVRTHAAIGLALLPVPFPDQARQALDEPPPPLAATYVRLAFAALNGLAALRRRGGAVDPWVAARTRRWAHAHGDALRALQDCFLRRGNTSGTEDAWVWFLWDRWHEATG